MCKEHEKVLCPKCLIAHKLCDFVKQGPELTYDMRKKFRNVLTTINLRHNLTQATDRKLVGALEGLDMYRDMQIDEINYSFNEIQKTLEKRRDFLIKQVTDLVT